MFSLLRASNYHYNKKPVIVDNITILKIHVGLFFIIILQSKLLRWVINIVFISIQLIVLKNGYNVPLYIELWWYSYFCYLEYWNIFYHFFSQISNLCFLCTFCHNVFRKSKSSINSVFLFWWTKPPFIFLFVGRQLRKIYVNVYHQ